MVAVCLVHKNKLQWAGTLGVFYNKCEQFSLEVFPIDELIATITQFVYNNDKCKTQSEYRIGNLQNLIRKTLASVNMLSQLMMELEISNLDISNRNAHVYISTYNIAKL